MNTPQPILRLKNRFRVEHDAQTEAEVSICTGIVSYSAILMAAVESDDYKRRLLIGLNHLGMSILLATGTPEPRAGRLGVAMAHELEAYMDDVVALAEAAKEAQGATQQ